MAIDTTSISYINYLWTKKNADGTLTGIRLDKLNLPTDVAYLSNIPTDYVTIGTASSGYFFNLHGEFDNHTIILFPTGSSNSFSVSFDSTGSSPTTVYGFLICSHYSTPGIVKYFNSSGALKSASVDALTTKSSVVYMKF